MSDPKRARYETSTTQARRWFLMTGEDQFRQRFQDTIQMRSRREMNGNVIEVEREHSSNNETNPPSRFGRRDAALVMLACAHKEHVQTIGTPAPASITYFPA